MSQQTNSLAFWTMRPLFTSGTFAANIILLWTRNCVTLVVQLAHYWKNYFGKPKREEEKKKEKKREEKHAFSHTHTHMHACSQSQPTINNYLCIRDYWKTSEYLGFFNFMPSQPIWCISGWCIKEKRKKNTHTYTHSLTHSLTYHHHHYQQQPLPQPQPTINYKFVHFNIHHYM